jgi:hypothetical protein
MIGTQQVTTIYLQSPPGWHGFCFIQDMSNNTLMTQTLKPEVTIESKGELQC